MSVPCLVGTERWGGESSASPPLVEIPLETLRHTFDQVRVIDGQRIQPNVALPRPYFAVIKKIHYNEWRRTFRPMILPTSSSKWLAKWQEPFRVTRRVRDVDYEVRQKDWGGARQIYRLNPGKCHDFQTYWNNNEKFSDFQYHFKRSGVWAETKAIAIPFTGSRGR